MITLCDIDAIPEGASKGFELSDGRSLFAVRKDGAVHLYRNRCPHRGVELNIQEDDFLDMDGALIICSAHGALFQIDTGECLAGPCQGDWLEPVPFEIRDGALAVSAQG
ncbi:MAG TPA: Rieske (2Fe-2S) protein [Spongiibacteraceae bacterium]|jgi:nitrite reductase/ring-hydroxylating ferredoxin subunit|nr:Rieske (2Fe-2S) protein [Spongiibacteraceae bacterium]HUH37443.1 Rieske (2Fe-2S) protein [Spongiibacteraceae bacterium]